MRFQQLRYFVAAVEEGSLSKAARVVHVAQPALSQQLMALERSLSAKLLERLPTGVRPTAAGEVFLQHARGILEHVERARHDVLMEGSKIRGDVHLVIPIALSELLTPHLLRRANDNFPDVRLRIQEGTSVECRALLENARVDLGVLPESDHRAKVESVRAMTQHLYLVGAIENEPAAGAGSPEIRFRDAAETPLAVVAKPHSLRIDLERWAEAEGVALNIVFESASSRLVRSYVASGVANAILPWSSFSERYQLGQYFARRISDPGIDRSYDVVWPKQRPLNRPSLVVKDLITETLTELAANFPD